MTATHVVLEGDALADLDRVAADRPDAVRVDVDDAAGAVDAVRIALGGATVIAASTAGRDLTDRLCDDLRRLGPVEHRLHPGEPSAPAGAGDAADLLSADEVALLGALLGGRTLGAAAAHLHLSRRTADRRLAAARRALGAAGTAQALQRAAALGVRPT